MYTKDIKKTNLTAYDGVESLDNFNEKSFCNYCNEKLAMCDKHVAFLKQNCVNKLWSGKVCEIGSGNSKLLYRLEQDNLLNEGIGIEISKSRHIFAEKFKEHVSSSQVTNLNQDVFDIPVLNNFDIVIGVDIVYQLITPLYEDSENDLLNWMNSSLRPGGFILLELWDFDNILKQIELSDDNIFRTWEEFSGNDPFMYVLSKLYLSGKNIVWQKYFYKRQNMECSEFTNIIRPYSREEIKLNLEKNGFSTVKIFDCWIKPNDTAKGEYIVLAQKNV